MQCPEAATAREQLGKASPDAMAVAQLEGQSGEHLQIVQRWSFERPHVLPRAPFAFTILDGQVQIIDAHTGRLHARIARLYYGASDPKGGAVEHGARVFEQAQCLHRPEVYPGIGEADAAALLRAFFAERR